MVLVGEIRRISVGAYLETVGIKFSRTKRQMACALEVSYGGIVLLHMRYVEQLLSDLIQLASANTYIRTTVDEP